MSENSARTSDPRLDLCDGKYSFYVDAQGILRCDRNGHPWREFVGDKAAHALFDEVTGTCEWAEIDDGLFMPGCENEEWHLPEDRELYPHCPYCGKKVQQT